MSKIIVVVAIALIASQVDSWRNRETYWNVCHLGEDGLTRNRLVTEEHGNDDTCTGANNWGDGRPYWGAIWQNPTAGVCNPFPFQATWEIDYSFKVITPDVCTDPAVDEFEIEWHYHTLDCDLPEGDDYIVRETIYLNECMCEPLGTFGADHDHICRKWECADQQFYDDKKAVGGWYDAWWDDFLGESTGCSIGWWTSQLEIAQREEQSVHQCTDGCSVYGIPNTCTCDNYDVDKHAGFVKLNGFGNDCDSHKHADDVVEFRYWLQDECIPFKDGGSAIYRCDNDASRKLYFEWYQDVTDCSGNYDKKVKSSGYWNQYWYWKKLKGGQCLETHSANYGWGNDVSVMYFCAGQEVVCGDGTGSWTTTTTTSTTKKPDETTTSTTSSTTGTALTVTETTGDETENESTDAGTDDTAANFGFSRHSASFVMLALVVGLCQVAVTATLVLLDSVDWLS